jgi:hypothetical protein
VYGVTVDHILPAITNAFASASYHDMLFVPSPDHYDAPAHRWSGRPATNEWCLCTAHLPLTLVPRGKKMVAYYAEFELTVEPAGTNSCKVTVTTISASVPDGKEIGIHGGWAVHSRKVPPILTEETNVLSRIERQLHSMQGGDPEPLPATPDTKGAADYPMNQLMEFNLEAKKAVMSLIKAMTNSP